MHIISEEESGEGTVWKFQDFSVIQILREINFGKFRTSTTAIFPFFELRILLIW